MQANLASRKAPKPWIHSSIIWNKYISLNQISFFQFISGMSEELLSKNNIQLSNAHLQK